MKPVIPNERYDERGEVKGEESTEEISCSKRRLVRRR
jgi:hypothetical protein